MGQAKRSDVEKRPDLASARRPFIYVYCGTLLLAQAAVAGERAAANTTPERPTATATVNGDFLVPVRRQLTLAYRFAQEKIRGRPTCSALFMQFGVDGAELLARVRFAGATYNTSFSVCKDRIPAYTTVGSNEIMLCPRFGRITVSGAALILIHEVLHSAGLTEKPSDPNGLTAWEINRLVQANCDLQLAARRST